MPAADSFSVDDVLCVEALSPSSVRVDITFQVTFVKSTLMRYLIEKSTNAEMIKWLEIFFAHLKKIALLFKEGKLDMTDPYAGAAALGSGEEEVSSSSTPPPSVAAMPSISTHSEGPLPPPPSLPPTTSTVRAISRDAATGTGTGLAARVWTWLRTSASQFQNESLGDRLRVLFVAALVVFLLLNHLRWGRATGRMERLENKVEQLERMVQLFLKKMEEAAYSSSSSSSSCSGTSS